MSYGKSVDFLFNQIRHALADLAGGWVYFYSAGTTNPKNIYLDRELSSIAANPYQLSADGTAELFGDGLYRIVIKNASFVTIYDYDDVSFVDNSDLLNSQTINERDLFYQNTLDRIQFLKCYYDIFAEVDTLSLGGSTLPQYSSFDFSYYGLPGSTAITGELVDGNTYYGAWLYMQADTTGTVSAEYSTDNEANWDAVPSDGYIPGEFNTLKIKFTWLVAGKMYSFGLFYDYSGSLAVVQQGFCQTSGFNNLTELAAQISTDLPVTIVVDSQISVGGGSPLSLPDNADIKFEKNGGINLDQNLTINGVGYGKPNKVFTGTGTVTFASPNQLYVNAEWWGATSAGLQLAVNAFKCVNLTGAFTSSSTVLIPSNTEIFGTGTISRDTAAAIHDFITNSDAVAGNVNIKIIGITIDGNKLSLAAENAGDRFSGIKFTKVTGNNVIESVTVKGTVNNETGGGIYLDQCSDVFVSKCTVYDHDRTGIVVLNSTRCSFIGNACYSNDGSGITGSGNTDNKYIGNRCYNNGTNVLSASYTGLNGTGTRSLISGNICSGNTGAGIASGDGALSGNYSIITENICYDNTLEGIYAVVGRGQIIKGNNCYNNGNGTSKRTGISCGYTAWSTGASIAAAGTYRRHLKNVYISTGSTWPLTTGASPPVHTAGTASDGTVSWAFVSSEASGGYVVAENTCTLNGSGGIFASGDGNLIYSNNCTGNNSGPGIMLEYCTNSSASNNLCTNNGVVTSANSCGMLISGCTSCCVFGNQCYDDLGAGGVQESGIWLAGGTSNVVNDNLMFTNKTNSLRTTSTPAYSSNGNKYGTDSLQGTFTPAAGASTFTVNNNNSRGITNIKVWFGNSTAISRKVAVTSVVVGTSFTVTTTDGNFVGTEVYNYEIM
jgi:parallel beta-helix repeat protein